MLPRKLRITFNDFRNHRDFYRKTSSSLFTVFIKKKKIEEARFFITVPKILDKRSTRRNLTKRKIERIILDFSAEAKLSGFIMIKPKKILTEENQRAAEAQLVKILKNEIPAENNP